MFSAMFSAGVICKRMKGNKAVKAKTTARKLLCKLKEPVMGLTTGTGVREKSNDLRTNLK